MADYYYYYDDKEEEKEEGKPFEIRLYKRNLTTRINTWFFSLVKIFWFGFNLDKVRNQTVTLKNMETYDE